MSKEVYNDKCNKCIEGKWYVLDGKRICDFHYSLIFNKFKKKES